MRFLQPKCCALSKPMRLNGTFEIFYFTHPPDNAYITFLSFVESQAAYFNSKLSSMIEAICRSPKGAGDA